MKRLMKSLVLMAAAAVALASCAKENVSEQNKGGQKFAEVSFNAEIPAYRTTKSTIDVDGLNFNTRWAEGDQMGLMCEYGTNELKEIYNRCGTYSKGLFTAELPEFTGMWFYYGYYPYQKTEQSGHYVNIPFGTERVQNGNEFNSAYDIMCAEYIAVNDAEQGKTDSGEAITFKMKRQTALLYFHFTTDGLDEPLTKATLTVEGDPIAADTYSLYYYGKNLSSDSYGTSWTSGDSQSITLSFTNAPSTKDFTLWFNILPYVESHREKGVKNMKLVVETANKTLTLNAADEELYLPGHISKVEFKNIAASNWKDKTTPTPPATKAYYEKVTTAPTDWSGDYLIVYETGSVAFDGSLTTIDVANNGKAVTITNNQIEATDETDAISFVIDAVDGGYTIQSKSGKYIDGLSDKAKNGVNENASTKFVNTISINQITGSQGQIIKYNKASDQCRFRYYTSNSKQEKVTLFRRNENITNRPTLTVNTPESLSFTAQGGTTEVFTVATNQETWKAVSDNEDFTVIHIENGFTVSTNVNPTLSERTATITVSAGSAKSQTFTITQSAATFKFYQTGSEEVVLKAAKGDTKQITIVSDYNWEAEIPANAKFSVTPAEFTYADVDAATSGTAKRQAVVFKTLEDNASEEGTLTLGTVTFSNKQNDTKLTVTVKQETSYVPPVINLSPESLNVTAETTSASFGVQSNVAWTVTVDDSDWITDWTKSGSNNGTVNISFSANTTDAARTATFTVKSADNTISKTFKLTQKAAGTTTTVTDVLTAADFAATTTTYKNFSNVTKTSKAVYAGNSAKNKDGAIQLRSKNSNSGIVTTTSGGIAKSVKITVASGTGNIDIYGSNTAYTSASNLYATSGITQGTKIGSLSKTGTITIEGSYKYIGIRSNDGAVYISSIEIVWE